MARKLIIAVFLIVCLIASYVHGEEPVEGEDEGCGCSQATRSAFTPQATSAPGSEQIDQTHHVQAEQYPIIKLSRPKKYEGMVKIPGGAFKMGSEDKSGYPADGEGPVRKVTVDTFWMDTTEVSNKQFYIFVARTKYVTEAETFGWSFVFEHFITPEILTSIDKAVASAEWWLPVPNATWRTPEGIGSSLNDPIFISHSHDPTRRLDAAEDRWEYPVTHVSWNDAVAYCKWVGRRLPYEAEWEYAARGGLKRKEFPLGNDILLPTGEHQMNIWQGTFPKSNEIDDGYYGPARTNSFQPNGYGLYNMCGNVWEWVADWWTIRHSKEPQINPHGPTKSDRGDPSRVMRGGSYLCHDSYCRRYRTHSRSKNTPDSSTGNLGFRCAADDTPNSKT